MDFSWPQELLDFRDDVNAFIQEWRTPELLAEYREREGAPGPLITKYYEALNERGWMRMCWPKEYGGDARDPLYRFVLIETMEYWQMPYGNLTYTSIAPSIAAHGTDEQKRAYLPGIFRGEYTFAIGYSEPNAGTDLASLRTRAELAGDEWIIQGQKIWTSLAAQSTHIWLAARTDPDSPRHQGISLIIVPTDTEGVTIRPLPTMSGMVTYETFYDQVRVPKENLLGPLHGGWPIIMHALNHERVGLAPTGNLARNYDLLVEHLKEHRPDALGDPVVRDRLAEIRVDLGRQRALAIRNANTISQGGIKPAESSMAKIWSSELRSRMSNLAIDLLGRYGGLTADSGDLAPSAGRHENQWRLAPIMRFGGGTNEVQRSIIATMGLGMPR